MLTSGQYLQRSPDDSGSGGGADGAGGASGTEKEELAALKRNNAAVLRELREARDKLKPYEGIDPEAVRKLVAEKEKAEADALKAKGDWDSREQALRDAFSKEKAPLEQRVRKLETTLFDALGKAKAVAAIADAKGRVRSVLPAVLPFLKMVEEDDRFEIRVVDQMGKERIADSKGNPFTVEALVAELRADSDFKDLFLAPAASGAGAPPGGGAGAPQGGVRMVDPRDTKAMVMYADEIRAGKAKVMVVDS